MLNLDFYQTFPEAFSKKKNHIDSVFFPNLKGIQRTTGSDFAGSGINAGWQAVSL